MSHLLPIKALLLAAAVPAILAVTAVDVSAASTPAGTAGETRPEEGVKDSHSGQEGPKPKDGNDDHKEGHDDQKGRLADHDENGHDGKEGRGKGGDARKATPKPVTSSSRSGSPTPGPVSAPTPVPPAPAPQLAPTPQPAPTLRPALPASNSSGPIVVSFAVPPRVAIGSGTASAGVVLPEVLPPLRRPTPVPTPRDPEQSPLAGVFVVIQPALPASLVAAVAGLPLLLVIWIAAFLRIASIARRELAARTHLALAAELGIAPMRLAGLLPRELSLLREKVAFDELTGIMRRGGGLATLDREIARARRRNAPLSVAFVDVDGLKAVNDARGHAAGDALLKDVADVLGGRLRAEDAIFRYGGDEFCCILPDATLDAAGRIVDEALLAARARGGGFSVGLAQLSAEDDRASLLARADAELYRGRQARGHGGRA